MSKAGKFNDTNRLALLLDADREYARSNIRGLQRARMELVASGQEKPGQWEFRLFRRHVSSLKDHNVRKLIEWEPDGVIIEAGNVMEIAVLEELRCPFIRLGYETETHHSPTVCTDENQIGELAAAHLLDIGVHNFAFYHQYDTPWTQCRLHGFVERLKPRPVHISPAAPTAYLPSRDFPPEAREALLTWLKTLPVPIGIFAACDDWGIRVVECAHTSGLRVPEDVAVLGADDDYLLCNMVIPALSSVRQAGELVGRTAFNLLRDIIYGVPPPQNPVKIKPLATILRASTDVTHIADPAVKAAFDYIRRHRDECFGVKQMLPHVGLNRRSLEIRFRRLCGRTLGQEIRRARLERVKALLQSDMTVEQIAQTLNFPSGANLARTFRHEIGVTPSEYRREVGEY